MGRQDARRGQRRVLSNLRRAPHQSATQGISPRQDRQHPAHGDGGWSTARAGGHAFCDQSPSPRRTVLRNRSVALPIATPWEDWLTRIRSSGASLGCLESETEVQWLGHEERRGHMPVYPRRILHGHTTCRDLRSRTETGDWPRPCRFGSRHLLQARSGSQRDEEAAATGSPCRPITGASAAMGAPWDSAARNRGMERKTPGERQEGFCSRCGGCGYRAGAEPLRTSCATRRRRGRRRTAPMCTWRPDSSE